MAERRHLGPAQRTAEEHGDDGGVAFSDQRSAFSLLRALRARDADWHFLRRQPVCLVAAIAGVRIADMRMVSQALHRQLRRFRVPCGDCRLRREFGRTAHR